MMQNKKKNAEEEECEEEEDFDGEFEEWGNIRQFMSIAELFFINE